MLITVDIASAVAHPHIVAITSCDKGRRYFVMMYDPCVGRRQDTVLEEDGGPVLQALALEPGNPHDLQDVSIFSDDLVLLVKEAIL